MSTVTEGSGCRESCPVPGAPFLLLDQIAPYPTSVEPGGLGTESKEFKWKQSFIAMTLPALRIYTQWHSSPLSHSRLFVTGLPVRHKAEGGGSTDEAVLVIFTSAFFPE